ncbi:MAG: ArsR/SmtB family transcription factor [Anaerolineae bacterium]
MDMAARLSADQPQEGEFAEQSGEQHSNSATLPNAEVERRAKIFSALGNETRLKILKLLLRRGMRVSDIVESVAGAASTVAHHLRTLEDAGLVTSRRDGRSTYYAVQKEELIKYHIFE